MDSIKILVHNDWNITDAVNFCFEGTNLALMPFSLHLPHNATHSFSKVFTKYLEFV